MRILLADLDQELAVPAPSRSKSGWHQVQVARDGAQALERWEDWHPDVLVIGTDLPGIDALDFVKRVTESSTTHVLLLSDRHQEEQMLRALDLGADAFINKPVNPAVLFARIEAIARRSRAARSKSSGGAIRVGRLMMDPTWHLLTWDDLPVDMTRQQFRILYLLALNAGKPVTHWQLIDYAWEHSISQPAASFAAQVARLGKQVARIRGKVRGAASANANPIVAVHGWGYRLNT
jgi:DNA-binding response OmpR family regulator